MVVLESGGRGNIICKSSREKQMRYIYGVGMRGMPLGIVEGMISLEDPDVDTVYMSL